MSDTTTRMMQLLKGRGKTNSTSPSENSDSGIETDDAKVAADLGPELAEWVKAEYQKCKSNRAQIQKQWEYNLLMYGGKQWAQMMFGGKIETPRAPTHRVRSITNLLRPMGRMEMTRLNNQKPSASVVPVSGSDDDMFAAQAGEAVWESFYSRKKLHQLGIRESFWVVTCGNGFQKVWWDKNQVDKSFLTVDTALEKPMPTVGDVNFGVVTPFNMFVPDLLVEEIEDQPYVIEAYTKSVTWVNQFWKDALSKPVVANVVGRFEVFESAYFGANGNDGSALPDSVLVLEAYIKPGTHAMLPEGGMVTVVGDECVQFYPRMPYSHGEYPYSHTKHISTGKFYGESVFTDIIPLQKEYNRTRSQIIESKIRTARNQLMYQEGSIDPRRITSRPGEMIPVKMGYQYPQPLPAQPIPTYVLQELDVLKQDIEDISGQHAVSRGSGPGGGIVAATAINYLQEQDDSLMYVTYASVEASYEKRARHALSIVADFWDLPKIIRTIGTDGAFDAVELKGSDIANGVDVRVEPGSSLPTSKSARQAFLMDLLKFGAITPEQMLDLIDIGGVKKLTELIRVDMKSAQRENIKLKKKDPMEIQMSKMQFEMGQQPNEQGFVDPSTYDEGTGFGLQREPVVPVNDWDNHKVHIEVHNRFRKSQEFELLDPLIKEEFANHIMHHEIALMMDMQRMMPQQPGQPGEMPPGMVDPSMEEDPSAAGAGNPADPMAAEGGMPSGNEPTL